MLLLFCPVLCSNNAGLFANNLANLPQIGLVMTLGALGPVLKKEPELLARVLHLILQMEAQLPANLKDALWSNVPQNQQAEVRLLLQQQQQHQQA